MNNEQSSFVTIAVLGKPRGNRGELTATSMTGKPERFQSLREVYVASADSSSFGTPFPVERVWHHDGTIIFKFAGIDSISDAEQWRGAEVRVPASERVGLDPGEFFHSDLIGCELRDRVSGKVYGKVTEVQDYGGPTLLEIDGGTMLVPFVKAICVEIRPDAGYIAVDLPAGLEDLSKP